MAKVVIKGLHIVKARGRFYVYIRATREILVGGFDGDRAALNRHLASPEVLARYGSLIKSKDRSAARARGTLGELIEFYQKKDRWLKLADRTKADYQKVIDWLTASRDADGNEVLDVSAAHILPSDIAETRDRAADEKYPKFSNDVVAFLSAVFGTAVEYRDFERNPAKGIRRIHKSDKSANRRWSEFEWRQVFDAAPSHLRKVLGLARWAGLRGIDIPRLRWDAMVDDPEVGPAVRYTATKNGVEVTIPRRPELDAVLAEGKEGVKTLTICANSLGLPYPTENAMRKAFQDFKAAPAFLAACPTGADLTLHGLRVTFASELKDWGLSNREIADLLGDKTESMGEHYARFAEIKHTVMRMRDVVTKNAL